MLMCHNCIHPQKKIIHCYINYYDEFPLSKSCDILFALFIKSNWHAFFYVTGILQTVFKFVFGKSADDSDGHVLSETGKENALSEHLPASVDQILLDQKLICSDLFIRSLQISLQC